MTGDAVKIANSLAIKSKAHNRLIFTFYGLDGFSIGNPLDIVIDNISITISAYMAIGEIIPRGDRSSFKNVIEKQHDEISKLRVAINKPAEEANKHD